MSKQQDNSELQQEISRLVTGLKIEYYDLLHKHGFADFKLGKSKPPKGYDEDEEWLSDIYEKAWSDLLQKEVEKAKDEIYEMGEKRFVQMLLEHGVEYSKPALDNKILFKIPRDVIEKYKNGELATLTPSQQNKEEL